jgi:hypothetical protein
VRENVNEETNSCINDGKLYVNKVKYSNATGCSDTRYNSASHDSDMLFGLNWKVRMDSRCIKVD